MSGRVRLDGCMYDVVVNWRLDLRVSTVVRSEAQEGA